MKKFMMFLVMVVSVVMLTACRSGSSVKSIDGEYYEFYTANNGTLQIAKGDFLDVKESTVKTWDGEYLIDKEKQVVEVGNGQVKSYTVDSETGVITFDEKTYVKVGSEYYQKLIDDGAKE